MSLEQREGSYPLVRLEFTGDSVDAPLISQVAREFNIDISILSADMDYAGGVKFGLMLAEFLVLKPRPTKRLLSYEITK